MTAVERTDQVWRHPWLETFERAPEASFADFLAGYAPIHPYDRADAPDAARMLFAHLPADDSARRALDGALLACLEQRRRAPLPHTPPRRQRFIAETAEAFEIVAGLRLRDAATSLRRRFVLWNEWTQHLVLAPSRDARAAYWRMLALTQPLLADEPALVDLEPLWHRLCREAGNVLPQYYLDIGLLGLRRLPGEPHDATWLTGLAIWAKANDPADAAFKAAWLPLKTLYPRAPRQWRRRIGELLQSPAFADIEPPGWWRCDPNLAPLAKPATRKTIPALRSPMPEDCQTVVDQLQPSLERSRPAIDKLMNGHRRYLEATGESRYFVRAVHMLGRAMLRVGGDDHLAYCRLAEAFAREGLGWEPQDRHLWSLWCQSLEARGAVEAAELVAWEYVRRDPANPDARTQLALLLARQPSQRDDAERLLRETIERFPDNAVARTQLAELLIAEGRLPDARAVVDAAIVAGTANAVTWAISARLWSNAGDTERALEAVEHGLAVDPGDKILAHFRVQLRSGRPLNLESAALGSSEVGVTQTNDAPLPEGVARRGRLRRLRFAAERGEREAALAEIRQVLAEEPGFTYAALLAAREQQPTDALPGFALAFEAALAAEDRATLEALAEQFPRLEALTWVARAVLGDEEAASRVAAWLVAEDRAEPAVQGLKSSLRPFLQVIEGGAAAVQAFVERRAAIETYLHDANEAALDDFLAAA